jgi:adenine-specific DNA-methyltransferase
MTAQDKRIKNRRQLQSLLRELFQFDYADLDFGIYRILNQKRDDIERFIEHDLLDAVDQALAHFQAADRQELETELAQLRRQLGPAIDEKTGMVRDDFRSMPIAQDYTRLHQQLRSLQVAEETEARIFNDLWRFFSRYYDDGDFLTERRYSSRDTKFCVPYNGEEVLLHWANRDQYYVKTSERFTDYRFTAGEYTVWFRLQHAEVEQDNVKGDKRQFVLRTQAPLDYDAETHTLTVFFEYRPITEEEEARSLATYNAQQPQSSRRKTLDRRALCTALEVEILAGLDDAGLKTHLAAVPGGRETSPLGHHLNRYTARNTMDYFVHKDLGGFLRRELDFFLKNEVLRIDDVIGDESGELMPHVLTRLRVVRQIAAKIIAFLAQIENFQKRLFEKKKFVVQTDYCVTLDRVPEELYPDILANEAQLAEWQRLYNVAAWENDLFWQGEFDEAFLASHPYAMVDTAFFDGGFKARLLASFEDLDNATDGVLIHGENFQALNLLMPKYGGQVQCIYIDPPYNTDAGPILYKNNYRNSSWIALMSDRLHTAKSFLKDSGILCATIDDYQQKELHFLLECEFGAQNLAGTVAIRSNPSGRPAPFGFAQAHEYAIFATKTPGTSISKLPRTEKQAARYRHSDDEGAYMWELFRKRGSNSERRDRPSLYYPIYVSGASIRVPRMKWDDEARTWQILEEPRSGEEVVFPIDKNGTERTWRGQPANIIESPTNYRAKHEGEVITIYYNLGLVQKTYFPLPSGSMRSTPQRNTVPVFSSITLPSTMYSRIQSPYSR